MATEVKYLKQAAPDFKLKRGSIKTESGLYVQREAKAIFDTALLDSAGVSNKTVAAHGLGVFLPIGAIITKAYWQVKIAFTSVDSTATIALKAQSTADLYAATAVSGAPGTAGFLAGVPDGTITHMISLTAERELVATVGVEALTAGQAILVVEYTMGL